MPVQVGGPPRSSEYEKDGVKHRSVECKVESILKLDRAERQEITSAAEDERFDENLLQWAKSG